MTRVAHVLTMLGVIAVPAVGWFAADWSGATTLVVYWFETLAVCVFICARLQLHRRWKPLCGHFDYRGPTEGRRSGRSASFISGFALVAFSFSAVHALMLGTILLILNRNGYGSIIQIDWRSVVFGCLTVVVLLALDFLVDLIGLRQWTFWQLEQLANGGLSRVIVVHMTLIFGFLAVAITSAPDAFFGVFVVLKSLTALSGAIPQYEPASAPKWLSSIMNRVPNVRPGERFEEVWAQDRAAEQARRRHNEKPWARR
ncbi:hypothetical protein BVC93_27220 [Mycobacterium sp. MS1601]|uniref:DUF6498-containing protein n=1 Tax=Mycobacterium sp. MS1601 TaxID=1936029 RepID=UPI0009795026|nr:DUF6498-containing protein [Mycobacterium sp. MS1601]AQA05456.1 hypothetical protein BVC93_27220 [Mycobacterium sp. MS1601]